MLGATLLQPWFPEKATELQFKADYRFQYFNEVASSSGDVSYHARDNFVDVSLFGSAEGYGVEAELIVAGTKKYSTHLDCFKLTGLCELYNDSVGDPYSLMVGVSAIIPTTHALDDISSFHHGHFEMETHLSIGKEEICYDQWQTRYWALIALGCAFDKGSPWARLRLQYENHWNELFTTAVFTQGLWGFGGKSLDVRSFEGYGAIAHRSIEVGASLCAETECGARLSLEYIYRPYAHDYPQDCSLFTIGLLYPFAI